MDCIFCKIISGEIPSRRVFEDEHVLAFHDINPQTPVHIVVIPKIHVASADGIDGGNSVYIAKIFEAIPKIAKQADLGGGYRVITNCGRDARQTVPHLHFHILGGTLLPETFN